MKYLMQGKEGVSFKQLSKDLDFMERTKSWRNSWKALVEDKGLIEATEGSTSMYADDYQLTQAGKDHASTPEYKQYLEEMNFVPQSNEQHQEHLKKRLLNDKARTMFDLLLKYGALSRKELSLIIGVNDRSHGFNYGLKDVKEKGFVVTDTKVFGKGKELMLTDKAFLDHNDRPDTVALDVNLLKEGAKKIESRKRKKSDEKSDAKPSPAKAARKVSEKIKTELGESKEKNEESGNDGDTVPKDGDSGNDEDSVPKRKRARRETEKSATEDSDREESIEEETAKTEVKVKDEGSEEN